MKKTFAFLMGFLALALATTTAFFSVYGISKLFMGEALAVIILFGLLEAAKIVLISVYHQFAEYFKIVLKGILVTFIVILMCVTSIGVYGFLTSAYSSTSVEIDKLGGKTEMYDKKIEIKKEEKSNLNEQITLKNNRITNLSNLRKSQETRLDSLYQRGHYRSAKQTEIIIKEANNDINNIAKEVDSLNTQILSINDSISSYEMKKLEINSGDLSGEIGPLKFISTITGLPMDNVVNWLMLIFMFLADPGAVLLVILTNRIITIIRKENEEKRKVSDALKKEEEIVEVNEPEISNSIEEPKEESVPESPKEEVQEVQEAGEPEQEKAPEIEENTVSDDIVEYVSNDEGDFIKTDKATPEKTMISADKETIVPGIFTAYTGDNSASNLMSVSPESKSEYLVLLKKFYRNCTAKKGDNIPTFPEFKKILENEGINVKEKIMKDFLVICGLFNITLFNNTNGVYNKEYHEAEMLISQI